MRNLIRKMDSGTRMIAMLSLNLVLFLATSASGIYFLDSIKTEMHDIATQDLPITKALSGVTTHQLEQAVLVERVARLADARSGHVLELRRKSVEEFNALTAKVNKEFHEVEQITERAIADAHTDADKAEFRHLLELMKKADVEHQGFTKHASELFSQIESGRLAGLEERIETIEQEADKLDHELEAMLVEIEEFTQAALVTAEKHEQSGLITLLILAGVGIVISLTISILIMRMSSGLTKQARETDEMVGAAVSGDFSNRLDLEGKEGVMRNLAESMNTLSVNTDQAMSDISGMFAAFAEGDLTRKITNDYEGVFDKIAAGFTNLK